jgi:hypothetical protein
LAGGSVDGDAGGEGEAAVVRKPVANAVTVGLLVGALALTLLYVQSFWINWIWDKQSWVSGERRAHAIGLLSIAGRVAWIRSDLVFTSPEQIAVYEENARRIGTPRWERGWREVTRKEWGGWYGPRWDTNHRVTPDFSLDAVTVALPVWPVVIGAWWLAVWRLRRDMRRRRRGSEGRCLTCGYDLRASGAVCPECGAAG